jgi:sec-independent protein translocase protein TatB
MLNIGWGEFLIIGIIALLVIGPKELPSVLRTIGQWTTKLRRMASEFQGQFQEAMREAEMADLKKEVDDMTSQVKGYADFDPAGAVRKEFDHTQQQIENAFADKPAEPTAPVTSTEPRTEPSASSTPAAEPATVSTADAPVAAPPPSPSELETAHGVAEPQKSDAGGKPA